MSPVDEKISFLYKVFGPVVVGNDGINVSVRCPKCGNTSSGKKKLVIRLDNDQHHCWVCDLKGKNLLSTLRKYFPSYIDEYCKKYMTSSQKFAVSQDSVEENVSIQIPRGFRLLSTSLSAGDPDIKDTISYAYSRGLTTRDLWYFRLGTCSSGRFRRRLIMPSFDEDGHLNYFVGRSIDAGNKMKYVNAKVPKKTVIFNAINIDWSSELTLVEGPLDLVKCNDNATCLLGSSLSEDYALFRGIIQNSTPVLLAMDPDAAGKAQNIARKLSYYGCEVRMLNVAPFDDVGDMRKQDFIEAREKAKKWSRNDRLYHMISSLKSGSII